MSSGFRHGPSRSMRQVMVTSPILSVCIAFVLPCVTSPRPTLSRRRGAGERRHAHIRGARRIAALAGPPGAMQAGRHAGFKAEEHGGRGEFMRFKGKVALITAAASGIGRATANIIGREGGRIAAVDTNRERLDATISEIAAAGGEAHPYNADALEEDRVNDVVADVARRFGRIDILV